MKKRSKRGLSFFLGCILILASLAGCSKTGKDTAATDNKTAESTTSDGAAATKDTGEAKKEVVIKIWNNDVTTAGIQNNPVADEIAKKTGVRIEVVNGDAQKFKVLLAGGDLPDIIYSNYGEQGIDLNSLQKSGQLIALDELIDQYAPNIKNNFTSRLEYSKKFLSPDGKIYFIPIQAYKSDPNNQVVEKSGASVAFYTRYDLYKELGSPVIKTTDDYLKVLKQMQDAHPQTESGKKTYAISGWSDWGLWMYTIPYQVCTGTTNWLYGMMYDGVNQQPLNAYYCDQFWDGIKFYNQAYNMGILDPEFFTQKYDNYVDKLKEGQTFVTYANWLYDTANSNYVSNGHPEMGFEIIPTGLNYMYGVYTGDAPFGWASDYPMAITNNCDNKEKAMELLNFLYSEEGARLLNSGVEGVHWQKVDGVPKMTQEYYDKVAADPNYPDAQGLNYNKLSGISANQILSDRYPAALTKTNEEKAKANNPIDLAFIKDSGIAGVTFPGQVIASKVESGEYVSKTAVDLTSSLVKEPSDDAKTVSSAVDEYMKVAITEVIMAPSSDFDKKKQEVIDEINAKGYDKLAEEMMKLWKEAQTTAKNFKY